MNGIKLAKKVRERWPPVEIIVTSATRIESEEIPERGRFFRKPYRVTEIIEALHQMAP
jgi:hypothetical protein